MRLEVLENARPGLDPLTNTWLYQTSSTGAGPILTYPMQVTHRQTVTAWKWTPGTYGSMVLLQKLLDSNGTMPSCPEVWRVFKIYWGRLID